MKSILVTVWVIQRVCSKIAMATNNIWSVSSDRLISSLRLISNLDTEIALLFYTDQRTFSIFLGSQISVILANKTFLRRERGICGALSAVWQIVYIFSDPSPVIHKGLSDTITTITPDRQKCNNHTNRQTRRILEGTNTYMFILELEWILFLVLTIAAISFPRKSATKRKYRYQKLKFIGV